MDAREFFYSVAVPNYIKFAQTPNDIRLLWNALVSMNTVPEYLALHRLGYPLEVKREVLDGEGQRIRNQLGLTELQFCANAFKHVRKINRGEFTLTASSTGVSPNDQATWMIGGYDPVTVVHNAFATLKEIPELK